MVRPEGRARAARPLLFAGWRHVFAAEPWPRSYEAQVREAYLGNAVAQRAVRLVAESVAWAPVYRERGMASRRRPLVTPPLLETVATQLLLHGNAFVQVLQDARGAAGGAVRAAARAGDGRGRRGGLAGGLSLQGRRGEEPDRGARRARPAGRWSICARRIRSTTITGWAASARRRARWRCTMPPRRGTRRCSTMRRGRRAPWSTIRATARTLSGEQFERLRAEIGGAICRRRQCRAADAARRRAELAGDEPDARRHGFRRAEGGGGARDRFGLRRAADAARPARRFDLRQLSRGQPGAVAADRAAAGRPDPGAGFRRRWRPGGRGWRSGSTSTRSARSPRSASGCGGR